MKLVTLVRKTLPYIKPYSWKIAATMVLTVIGAFIAQINAIVLDGTVDAISNHVIGESVSWHRIAIARMFLKNPPIIFLDEPTASLDAVATEQIKDSIDAIKENRTVIFISHNISQIINSDMIYAMNEGRVDQSGPSLELYRAGGTYKNLVDATARSLNIDKLAYTIDLVEYLV